MLEESRKIRYIIRLRQRLRRWRKRAAEAAARRLSSDVPAGHVAVTVGPSCRRFVVPMTHLSHPLFQKLLLEAEEEYGFTHSGPLAIPCPEELFEDILMCMDRIKSMNPDEYRSCFHVGLRRNLNFSSSDSRPLLHGDGKRPIESSCVRNGLKSSTEEVGSSAVSLCGYGEKCKNTLFRLKN